MYLFPIRQSRSTSLLQFGEGSLEEQTAAQLFRIGGEPVDVDLLKSVQLPEHLQMLLNVVDDSGNTIVEGRCLPTLRENLNTAASGTPQKDTIAAEEQQWYRRGFTAWDFADLPVSVRVRRAGIEMPAWPAIQDDGDSVSLTLCQSAAQSQAVLKRGLRRLCLIQESSLIRKRIRNLGDLNRIQLLASSIRGIQLQDHLQQLMVERAYFSGKQLPRTSSEYDACVLYVDGKALSAVAAEFVRFLPRLFEDYHSTRRLLEDSSPQGWEALHKRNEATTERVGAC